MIRDELSVLSALLVVAEEGSFTKAAKRLRVSPSALSHAIKGLEENVGVRLLARTTRSVAPTDAGERLLSRLRPALGDIREALDELSRLRERPAGRVRLLVGRVAAMTVLGPRLGEFAREFPEIVLDVTTTTSFHGDLVAGRFDAGIQYGEFIERDMIAVKVSPEHRPAVVGSPGYFETHPKPITPQDLTGHSCINFRHGDEGIYRWELDKGDQSLVVSVDGPLVVDDLNLLIQAAVDGVGLAYATEEHLAQHIESGALVRVLEDWCPPFPGLFLYFPSRRHRPAALSALIEFLRYRSD